VIALYSAPVYQLINLLQQVPFTGAPCYIIVLEIIAASRSSSWCKNS